MQQFLGKVQQMECTLITVSNNSCLSQDLPNYRHLLYIQTTSEHMHIMYLKHREKNEDIINCRSYAHN